MYGELATINSERSLMWTERTGELGEIATRQSAFMEYLTVLAALFLPLNLCAVCHIPRCFLTAEHLWHEH